MRGQPRRRGLPRLGLRAQILLTLVVLLSVSLLVIYAVTRGVTRGALSQQRRESAMALASVAARMAATTPEEEWPALLGALTSRHEVSQVLVVDQHLEILWPAGVPPLWEPGDVRQLRSMMASGRAAFRYPRGPEFPELWVLAPSGPPPAMASDAPRVAALALLLRPDAPPHRRVVNEQLLLLFLAIIIGLLALVAHVALTRLVVRPVRQLIRTVERVAARELPALEDKAFRRAGSELRVLSDAVERMLQRLREDEVSIAQSIERLEALNKKLVRAQETLVRSEKLASVGQLAAGVAHEIGNPIAIVLGYLEILRGGGLSEEQQREFLDDIQVATDRINGIIRDLLDFARPAKEESRVVDVRRAIDNTLKLLEPQKKFKDLVVDVSYPDDGGLAAFMNEGRLQQVLLNLLINAADAVAGVGVKGGSDAPGGDGRVGVKVEDLGERLRVSIADRGPGIPESARRRIFDPFFTTKDPGEGTGLGLAICYSLVEACGGDLSLETELGEGTTFHIDLWRPEHAPDYLTDADGNGNGGRVPTDPAAGHPRGEWT